MRIRLALRNTLRNARRTALTVLMIAAGISAIVVFRGFSYHLTSALREVAINSQYGHLQIASEKNWNVKAGDSYKSRLMKLDPSLVKEIGTWPEVSYISERISFYGLISSADHSVSARGSAFDVTKEVKMQETIKIIKGRKLNPQNPYEVLLGSGLQKQMGTDVGANLSVLGYTVDGTINALDVEVVGIFQTELAEVDNSTFFMPLVSTKKLLDTEDVDRFIVQLKDTADTETVNAKIKRILSSDLQVKSWNELAVLYLQVVDYFRVQNMIIEWIIMLLVLFSVINTVGMAVSERIAEIGTMRALGENRWDIIKQFLTEGLIIGILGGVVGTLMGIGLGHFVTSLQLPIVTPNSSTPQLITVILLPRAFLDSFLLTCGVSIFASFFPALRASRINIIEALRYNI